MSNTRRSFALLTGVGILAISGLAAAQEAPDDVPEETTFNFGYDEANHVFVWNTSDTNGGYDCSLENGELGVEYTTEGETIVVDDLTTEPGGTETVTFPNQDDESLPDAPYMVDEECGLMAAEIAGPNGQINHGQFMKFWNSIYEGRGRGCINRFLAGSDLGKGDQQLRTGDVDPDWESVMDGDSGAVTFETALADCEREKGNGNANNANHGNANRDDEGEAGETGKANANPHASFNRDDDNGPDGSSQDGEEHTPRGRSGDAPGHNKD